jgi:hypothetical protein
METSGGSPARNSLLLQLIADLAGGCGRSYIEQILPIPSALAGTNISENDAVQRAEIVRSQASA